MPINDAGNASSGPAVSGLTLLPPDAVASPMPIAVGEPNPGEAIRMRIVAGTEGDDRLELNGQVAFGGGGDDTFVLTSNGASDEGSENLGTIMDFQAGDKLDLSQLGANAAILGRTSDASGGQRVSVDFDGDGKEDGYLVVHERGEIAGNDAGVITPGDGEMHILPYPMPGDDGVFTILPFPMPGDGEVTILPYPLSSVSSIQIEGAPVTVTVAEMESVSVVAHAGLRLMSAEFIA